MKGMIARPRYRVQVKPRPERRFSTIFVPIRELASNSCLSTDKKSESREGPDCGR